MSRFGFFLKCPTRNLCSGHRRKGGPRYALPVALSSALLASGCAAAFPADDLDLSPYHACDLLSEETAETVGVPPEPEGEEVDESGSQCVWADPETEEFVVISVDQEAGWRDLQLIEEMEDQEIYVDERSGYPFLTADNRLYLSVAAEQGIVIINASEEETRDHIAREVIDRLAASSES